MGCLGCSVSTGDGKVSGCNSKGGCSSNGCSTGGCNRLNTFDWLSDMDIYDVDVYDIVEVSFKNGARKQFFRNLSPASTGDMVIVDTGNGYDVGRISLSGDLVRMQMKKKRTGEDTITQEVIRKANERDLERLQEAREQEMPAMVRARAIARMLNLDMKVGDVEFQGDLRKATFFYTAEGRVDFRELIRHFAKEFKVKIEMRQIGARQESARVGGIGSCGRELCCSTWLSDFKSVSTGAARYQNLAINQSKLSGQCGRLKCCLNYELDTYMDALEQFPAHAERIETKAGRAILIKTDIFKKLLYYVYEGESGKGKLFAIDLAQVKEIIRMNAAGEKPTDLKAVHVVELEGEDDEDRDMGFEDVTGAVELPEEQRRKKKKKKKNRPGEQGGNPQPNRDRPAENRSNRPSPRPDRPERQDRGPRPERQDRPVRPDRPENQEKQDRPVRPENQEKQDRPVRPDRPENQDRPVRPDRPENQDRPERTDRPPVENKGEQRPDQPGNNNNRNKDWKRRKKKKNKGGGGNKPPAT